MNRLINATMGQAQTISYLNSKLFPTATPSIAAKATTSLMTLGSSARTSASEAGLLPCRVHAFFRGLPGLVQNDAPLELRIERIGIPGIGLDLVE